MLLSVESQIEFLLVLGVDFSIRLNWKLQLQIKTIVQVAAQFVAKEQKIIKISSIIFSLLWATMES